MTEVDFREGDWKYALAFATGGGFETDGRVTAADIKRVYAFDAGENDERDWVAVLELKPLQQETRWMFISSGCDYTGWDCQAGGRSAEASHLYDLCRWCIGEDERARLRLSVIGERL